MDNITFHNSSQVIACGLAGDAAQICGCVHTHHALRRSPHGTGAIYHSIPPNAKEPKSNCLICQKHRGKKKSTAPTHKLFSTCISEQNAQWEITVGRHRGPPAQTGLKTADCHSSARRLQAPSAACPFCQAAHALKPELKGELETSYSSRWFQAFFHYASTCSEQKAAKDLN